MDSNIRQDILSHGFHVTHAFPDHVRLPGWAHTVGFFETYGQPEVVTSGLPVETARHAFSELARRLAAGLTLTDGRRLVDLLSAPVVFRWVPHDLHGPEVALAARHYGSHAFPLLQLVWPDRAGIFPGEAGHEAEPPQHLLYVPRAAGPGGRPPQKRAVESPLFH